MDSIRKKKQPLSALNLKVSSDVIKEISKHGRQGTIGAELVNRFHWIKEFEATYPEFSVVPSLDGANVFPKLIDNNLLYLTTKKGNEQVVIELDIERTAHLILALIKTIIPEQ